jgi:ferredoxin
VSFKVLQEQCIGCGACDYSCPTGALEKADTFLGLFTIDPFRCDDCAICTSKCPERAIVPDPEWPVCQGHGCPLSSGRLADITCAVWQERCPSCGTTLWRSEGGEWSCPKCQEGRKVLCPRTHKMPVAFIPSSG